MWSVPPGRANQNTTKTRYVYVACGFCCTRYISGLFHYYEGLMNAHVVCEFRGRASMTGNEVPPTRLRTIASSGMPGRNRQTCQDIRHVTTRRRYKSNAESRPRFANTATDHSRLRHLHPVMISFIRCTIRRADACVRCICGPDIDEIVRHPNAVPTERKPQDYSTACHLPGTATPTTVVLST